MGTAERQVPSIILAQYWEFWIISVLKPQGTCQLCQLKGARGKEIACAISSYCHTSLWFLLPDFTVKINAGISRKVFQTFKSSL